MPNRGVLHVLNKNDRIKGMKMQFRNKKKLIRKAIVLGILAVMMLLMTGCGDQLVDLTDEEEAKIVTYAAHVISKFNKKQPDGLCYVPIVETEMEGEAAGGTSATEPGMQPGSDGTQGASGELPEGYHDPEEFADVPTTTGTNVDAIDPVASAYASNATPMELSDVIGIEGFDMQWTGTQVADDYVDPSGATLATPNKGNRYVILTVTIKNTTDHDLRCNIAELVPAIALIVNGSQKLDAAQMLVSTDFATYNADVPAGQSVDTCIFFQRKAGDIADSDTYDLEVTLNGVTGSITQR